MSLTRADREALLAVINHLLTPAARSILEAQPKLAPWVPDLQDHQRHLAAPSPPSSERTPLRPLDRRAEELLRILRDSLRVAANWRRHLGDVPLAAQLDALHGALYPEGLAFLGRALPIQAATTDRLLLLAQAPEHADALAAVFVGNDPITRLLTDLEEANTALKNALAAPTSTAASSDYAEHRSAAISTLAQLRTLIERNLDGDARAQLLKAFP